MSAQVKLVIRKPGSPHAGGHQRNGRRVAEHGGGSLLLSVCATWSSSRAIASAWNSHRQLECRRRVRGRAVARRIDRPHIRDVMLQLSGRVSRSRQCSNRFACDRIGHRHAGRTG